MPTYRVREFYFATGMDEPLDRTHTVDAETPEAARQLVAEQLVPVDSGGPSGYTARQFVLDTLTVEPDEGAK